MKAYIIRRLLYMVLTLFGASVLIFGLYALTPGDFVDNNPKLTDERKAELKQMYGLDKYGRGALFRLARQCRPGRFWIFPSVSAVGHLAAQSVHLEFLFDCVRLYLVYLADRDCDRGHLGDQTVLIL